MKFSIFTDMYGLEEFEDTLIKASEQGFSLIDLRGKLNGSTIDDISLEKAKELKAVIDQYNLKVNTINSWSVNPCAFSGPPKYKNDDENHHQKMKNLVEDLCDIADAFGAPNVRVYSLYRDEKFNLFSDEEKEEQYKLNAKVMGELAELAQRRRKVLVVENEPPTLTSNAKELGLLVKYADHPNLKVNWDIVNQWRAGTYPTMESYEHVKGYLQQTHLKGASRLSSSMDEFHPNGIFGNFAIAGKDDFEHEEIMQAIAGIDQEAVMVIDTHYHTFYQPDKVGEAEVIRLTKNYFKKLMN